MNQSLTQLISAFDVAQNYKKNMKFNIVTTTLPGVITLFGALFLGFGIVHSVILNGMSLTVGASNAIWPFLREQRKRSISSSKVMPLEKKEDELLIDSEQLSNGHKGTQQRFPSSLTLVNSALCS